MVLLLRSSSLSIQEDYHAAAGNYGEAVWEEEPRVGHRHHDGRQIAQTGCIRILLVRAHLQGGSCSVCTHLHLDDQTEDRPRTEADVLVDLMVLLPLFDVRSFLASLQERCVCVCVCVCVCRGCAIYEGSQFQGPTATLTATFCGHWNPPPFPSPRTHSFIYTGEGPKYYPRALCPRGFGAKPTHCCLSSSLPLAELRRSVCEATCRFPSLTPYT